MSKKRDYTRFSRETTPNVVDTVENVVEEIAEAPVKRPKSGVVENCLRLNVRAEADAKAEVVTIVGVGEDLAINEEESTAEFYKVRTVDGVEGYCMKKFVCVMP